MIVVADAGPVLYLVLIGSVDVLQPLYDQVIIPQTVADELQHDRAPDAVRSWIANLPDWCRIRAHVSSDPSLAYLNSGQCAAISLALSLAADRVLIDEWAVRVEAERQHLSVTGTLGVLAEAHRRRLLDFESAIAALRATSFYMSDGLVNRVRRDLSTGREDI